MKKEIALSHLKNNLSENETLIDFFFSQKPFSLWLFIIIGPLAVFSMKSYYIAITDKGVHFNQLNMLNKFSQHDFFTFDEIESLKIGSGLLQIPLYFTFKNGKKLKIKAQKKGVEGVAKIKDTTSDFLHRHIRPA